MTATTKTTKTISSTGLSRQFTFNPIDKPSDLEFGDNVNGPFYAVHGGDKSELPKSHVFFYVTKDGKEWLLWFPNGRLYSGFGKTRDAVVVAGMNYGWQYATNPDSK